MKSLHALAFASLTAAVLAAEPAPLHDAVTRFHTAAAENLPAAYRAAFADDGILMFLHARGRAELDDALAHRISPTAKFTATSTEEIEAASHDVGFVRGDYRLEFTRKSTGEHIRTDGRFVELWRKSADGEWQLFLTNWAGVQPAAPTPSDAATFPAVAATRAVLTGSLQHAENHFLAAAKQGIASAFLAHIAPDALIMFLDAEGQRRIEEAVATKIPRDARTFGEAEILVESAAHDLGWAWGPYRFAATVDAKPFESHGKFVTVWKRSPSDGAWRIALDHGTQDPEPAPPAPAATDATKKS
ncbi:MAG: nuclear transport factor 2 family protein [Candidatus Didemnitutus sp.]|nr:nuclear transport factor 2 family protein [Candidatus Didemnitutus sp.]